MSASAAVVPPPNRVHYVYAVVDVSAAAGPKIIAVRNTRADARTIVEAAPMPGALRVRRGKLTLYST